MMPKAHNLHHRRSLAHSELIISGLSRLADSLSIG
jgi:hypothetical protein